MARPVQTDVTSHRWRGTKISYEEHFELEPARSRKVDLLYCCLKEVNAASEVVGARPEHAIRSVDDQGRRSEVFPLQISQAVVESVPISTEVVGEWHGVAHGFKEALLIGAVRRLRVKDLETCTS